MHSDSPQQSIMRLTVVVRAVMVCASVVCGRRIEAQPSRGATPAVTAADIRFMQDMLRHHAQAVEMVALIPTRTTSPRLRLLGDRIATSQSDEMQLMSRWLKRHGGAFVADSHDMAAHRTSGHDSTAAHTDATMPGMLSPAQMSALRRARGARFDRLLLTGMIQHHTGALTMIRSLMKTPGAAQESGLNRFVLDVDADQRAEIARMRRMLSAR